MRQRYSFVYGNVALYEPDDPDARGWLRFFDVASNPPRTGRPAESATLDIAELAKEIRELVTRRNTAGFDWEVAVAETETQDEDEEE